jgi:hypothetical protein
MTKSTKSGTASRKPSISSLHPGFLSEDYYERHRPAGRRVLWPCVMTTAMRGVSSTTETCRRKLAPADGP